MPKRIAVTSYSGLNQLGKIRRGRSWSKMGQNDGKGLAKPRKKPFVGGGTTYGGTDLAYVMDQI
jgi:hypothetical protein